MVSSLSKVVLPYISERSVDKVKTEVNIQMKARKLQDRMWEVFEISLTAPPEVLDDEPIRLTLAAIGLDNKFTEKCRHITIETESEGNVLRTMFVELCGVNQTLIERQNILPSAG